MLNLRQIGLWALGASGAVLFLAANLSVLEGESFAQPGEWSVFPRACLVAGEFLLAAWFLGTAVRKKRKMPQGLGHAGIGLIVAGLGMGAGLIRLSFAARN